MIRINKNSIKMVKTVSSKFHAEPKLEQMSPAHCNRRELAPARYVIFSKFFFVDRNIRRSNDTENDDRTLYFKRRLFAV